VAGNTSDMEGRAAGSWAHALWVREAMSLGMVSALIEGRILFCRTYEQVGTYLDGHVNQSKY